MGSFENRGALIGVAMSAVVCSDFREQSSEHCLRVCSFFSEQTAHFHFHQWPFRYANIFANMARLMLVAAHIFSLYFFNIFVDVLFWRAILKAQCS